MRQRPVLEFRTPQHPSSLSNKWGGASPLLARNLPKEALDQRYSRLNAVRDRDQIFTEIFSHYPPLTTIQDEIFSSFSATKTSSTTDDPVSATRQHRKGILWRRLTWRPRKQRATTTTLGLMGSINWFPRLSSKNRWPNGWC